MPSVILRNATDAWVNSAAPSVNYAATTGLHLQGTSRYSYLFFNRAAPLGATITSAKLRVYQGAAWTGTRTISAQRIAAGWQVSRLTWNNRPAVTGTIASTTNTGGASGTVIEIDVTGQLQAVSDGTPWYGFRLATNDATARVVISANGLSAFRPTLEVAWTERPDAPTTLAPSGNRVVSVNKPLLRFDFTDQLGDTSLAAVQVQLSTTDTWTSPTFDSGVVATENPELNLADTAYAGLASGASIYWRVRVQDGAGLWSAWSQSEQFRYQALGTVSIDNPAAGQNLSDPTPPFLWSFTGGTQKAWQVLVQDPASPTTIYANSGKVTNTETVWTPPAMTLTTAGPYRVVVRVWDTLDREQVAGAPAYAQALRDFSIIPDPTVNGVVGLAVSQPTESKPRMQLTWTRSEAPDKFVVTRDDVVIADPLLPEDANTSGTNYRFFDDEARVWRAHNWQVHAVVNGKKSPSSVVVETPKQRGIWLLDKGRGLDVWLAGKEAGTWAIGEEASVFVPIGGKNIVRRVQARRGYEGSLSGLLVTQYGTTAAQYEADLLAMRNEPTRPVVLALGDLSIQVILGNITTYPLPDHTPPARGASFDFWQVLP